MAKKRKTKEEKAAEAAMDTAMGKALSYKQVNIMDLSKIRAEAEAAVAAGKTYEEATTEAVARYAIKEAA